MQPKILIINIALVFLLILMTINVVEIMQKTPSYPEAAAVESNASIDMPVAFKSHMPNEKNYDTIVSNNLFSEDRMFYRPSESDEIMVEKKIQGKRIVLSGVVNSGNHVKALISNPDPSPENGNKKNIWVEEGDKIANLKVVDIDVEENYIVLNDNGTKYKLLLYDKERTSGSKDASKQNNRESTAASDSPTVVTTSQPQKAAVEPQKSLKNTDNKEDIQISTPFGSIKRSR